MKRLTTTDIIEWYYEFKGDQYGYLVLNTEEPSVLQALKSELALCGITCLKQGKSFKPANNNKQYKTYLSIARAAGGRPTLMELRRAIRYRFPDFHYDASPIEIREYFNFLQDTIDQKDRIISTTEDKVRRMEASLQQLEETGKKQRAIFEDEKQALLTKVSDDATLDQMVNEEYMRHKEVEAELEKQYQSQIESVTKDFSLEINNLKSQLSVLQSEREQMLDNFVKVQEQNSQIQNQTNGKRRSGMTETDLAKIFCTLLPNLSIGESSIRYILDEVVDWQHVFRYLRQLNYGESVPFKPFASADGWWEVNKKISDGHAPTVRIYYKKHQESGKCLVCVWGKEYQQFTGRVLKELG